jgi:hypothetical protein
MDLVAAALVFAADGVYIGPVGRFEGAKPLIFVWRRK